mmetsp:Transcript_35930/g.70701  ORF Transcript_35930/g.70701 Transcript_35930/m.70701 type:complete len:292 (-) Transcript_35930:54-929(-)
MASSVAIRRLKREYALLRSNPTPGILVAPTESNFLRCNFIFYGSIFHPVREDMNPYEGGVYHGIVVFPPSYPMKPPSILLSTENGRFKVGTKICTSMTDFHPETWNPTWSVRSILVGLASFWNSDEMSTGCMDATEDYRIQRARKSLTSCLSSKDLSMLFPQLEEMRLERECDDGKWPPARTGFNAFVAEKVGALSKTAPKLPSLSKSPSKISTTHLKKTNDEAESGGVCDDSLLRSMKGVSVANAVESSSAVTASEGSMSKSQRSNAKKRAKAKAKKMAASAAKMEEDKG